MNLNAVNFSRKKLADRLAMSGNPERQCREFAANYGYSADTISGWIDGTLDVTGSSIKYLAEWFGVDSEHFMNDPVNHPAHYGGKDNPYEAIKVIEAWELGFNLGTTLKYICRAGKKGDRIEDLKKAAFYLNREIDNLSRETES